jgi:O-antigen ligase
VLAALDATLLLRYENALCLFLSVTFLVPGPYWRNPILLAAALAFGVYRLALGVARGETLRLQDLPPGLVLFAALGLLSLTVSHDLGDSLRIFALLASCMALCLLVRDAITSRAALEKFAGALFLTLFLSALYGFYQSRAGIEVRLEFVDLAASAGLPGRVFSTMENPNNYAELLALLLPVCFAYLLNRKSDLSRLVCAGMFLACLLVLVMTYSRSSYVVVAFAFGLFIFLRNKRLVPFAAALALLALPFLPDTVVNRFLSIGSDTSSTYRFIIWNGALRALREHGNWLAGVGIGPGAFGQVYRAYSVIEAMTATHSHNLFLQVWIEMGIFGLLAFLGLLASAWKAMAARAVASADGALKNYYAAFAASIAGITLFGMVEYVWYYPRAMLAFWVMLGLALGAARLETARP